MSYQQKINIITRFRDPGFKNKFFQQKNLRNFLVRKFTKFYKENKNFHPLFHYSILDEYRDRVVEYSILGQNSSSSRVSSTRLRSLSSNKLTKIDNNIFDALLNLSNLYFNNNLIENLSSNCFRNLKTLKVLDLRSFNRDLRRVLDTRLLDEF